MIGRFCSSHNGHQKENQQPPEQSHLLLILFVQAEDIIMGRLILFLHADALREFKACVPAYYLLGWMLLHCYIGSSFCLVAVETTARHLEPAALQ